MTKIILLDNTDPDGFELLCEKLDVKDYHFDENLIETLENLPISATVTEYEPLRGLCKNDPGSVMKVLIKPYKNDKDNGIRYVGWNEDTGHVGYARIESYDESKPHKIAVESGSEYIVELKMVQTDKQHNIWFVR